MYVCEYVNIVNVQLLYVCVCFACVIIGRMEHHTISCRVLTPRVPITLDCHHLFLHWQVSSAHRLTAAHYRFGCLLCQSRHLICNFPCIPEFLHFKLTSHTKFTLATVINGSLRHCYSLIQNLPHATTTHQSILLQDVDYKDYKEHSS